VQSSSGGSALVSHGTSGTSIPRWVALHARTPTQDDMVGRFTPVDPLDLLGPQNSGSCDKFCETRQSTTRRISYRPTWINDLTAPVIGERSAFCEKSGTSGRLGWRVPLPLTVRQRIASAGANCPSASLCRTTTIETNQVISATDN
jgi:hypothetical protein